MNPLARQGLEQLKGILWSDRYGNGMDMGMPAGTDRVEIVTMGRVHMVTCYRCGSDNKILIDLKRLF